MKSKHTAGDYQVAVPSECDLKQRFGAYKVKAGVWGM